MRTRKLVCLSLALLLALSLFPATSQVLAEGEKTQVVIWGLNPTVPGGDKEMVEEFNRVHDDIELIAETIPSSAGQSAYDNVKLMTAVAGGTPPDVSTLDRFLAGSWAIRGALTPLDEYLEGSILGPEAFVDAAWSECVLDGKTFAIPYSPGAMGFWSLAYNKDLLVAEGLVDDNGEAKPPVTWDELYDYAMKMTKKEGDVYDQIGFVPLGGASFLYQWSWANGGAFVSEDGRTATFNTQENREALEFLVKLSDGLGGAEMINDFSQGFTGAENDIFLKGKTGMIVIGEYFLPSYLRYNPDLNFAMTHFPKPTADAPTVSWGGGWSMVVPFGAANPEASFKAIEWLCGEAGCMAQTRGTDEFNASEGRLSVPTIPALKSLLPVYQEMYFDTLHEKAPAVADAMTFFLNAYDTYDKIYWRPHNPASDILWQSLIDAAQDAVYHRMSVEESLNNQNDIVQRALDDAWEDY